MLLTSLIFVELVPDILTRDPKQVRRDAIRRAQNEK